MAPHYVIYGAGGIGCVVGARLHEAGVATTLVARGAHAQALRERGLRLISPAGIAQLRVPTVAHPRELQLDENSVVVLCMKSQHTHAALAELAATAPADCAVVCLQNGVANERMALRYFRRVYASVVILPAMFLTPGEVVTHAQGHGGILDTGCFPRGLDETARRIAADLSEAGFSARPDGQIMRQKYAKLLANLYNVMQAGLRDFENAGPLRDLVRGEALACFAAAGIDCASKAETTARRAGVFEMADIPGYERTAGSSWQSVARSTGDIETDFLNGEICLLGRLHGVPTPANDACVAMARELLRAARGPGIFSAREILARVRAAESR